MQRLDQENHDVTTPLTSTSQFIEAGEHATSYIECRLVLSGNCPHFEDDDDLDEEAIPGFTHPGLVQSPHSPAPDKGKARAPEQLAPPSASVAVSGNIGTPVNGSGAPPSNRHSVGGVRVETRYVTVHQMPEEKGVIREYA